MNTKVNPRRWWALALLSAAQFLVILDTSIIGIALPDIQAALGFSSSSLQWVFSAYVIAFGGLLLLGGRLSDLIGARRVFVGGFLVLTASSLLAGLAWSEGALIAGRAFQGLGAALIAPSAMAIVLGLFTTPSELGKAMSIWGASAPAGGTAGVFLGGVITEWVSWRWTFLINVPVALLALAFVPVLLPESVKRRGRLDLAGAVTITAAISLAVYATVTAAENGWGSVETIGLFAVAAAFLGAFLVVEYRRREPLVPLGIFRAHNLSAANLVMALLGAAWIPMWFFLNLYLQQVLGYDAFEGGLALLPMTGAIMFLMIGVTGRAVARFGFKPPMIAGLALLAIGIALFARIPSDGTFLVDVLPASLVAAAGMSLAYIPVLIAGLSSAKPEEAGLASGLINTTYQVGSAVGLAAMTAVATGITGAANDAASLTDGYQGAFLGAAVVALVAAAVAAVAIARPQAASADLPDASPIREAA
ncbi:MAG: DHA2 family efflux MFS transporter permease subunit [Gaiellaceae bacterium MAG52_C11]|nr:DHA2 family efflux MFS transporter permease subunit [Candidatus Gaiellasilicea maunaloa]